MPFPYYDNLSASRKRIYRKSDAIDSVTLEDPDGIQPVVSKLAEALAEGKRREVATYASKICRLICEGLGIEPLVVKISTKRPSNSVRELHGLYEWTEGEPSLLTVWMKTAARGQVVAFKSFIRTVLHELCHHIDYEYFRLEDSFHTEGFFRRESSLYRQIVPPELQQSEKRVKNPPAKGRKKPRSRRPDQMELF